MIHGPHFQLIDAAGKVKRRIPIPDDCRGVARMAFEAKVRERYGVNDVDLFLRDSTLDLPPA